MTLGDRVAVLRDGVVQQCDVPQVLFRRPCNLFVAAFIGSPAMNLVRRARGRRPRALRRARRGAGAGLSPARRFARRDPGRAPDRLRVRRPARGARLAAHRRASSSWWRSWGTRRSSFPARRAAGRRRFAARSSVTREADARAGCSPTTSVRASRRALDGRGSRPPPGPERVSLALDPTPLHLFDAAHRARARVRRGRRARPPARGSEPASRRPSRVARRPRRSPRVGRIGLISASAASRSQRCAPGMVTPTLPPVGDHDDAAARARRAPGWSSRLDLVGGSSRRPARQSRPRRRRRRRR